MSGRYLFFSVIALGCLSATSLRAMELVEQPAFQSAVDDVPDQQDQGDIEDKILQFFRADYGQEFLQNKYVAMFFMLLKTPYGQQFLKSRLLRKIMKTDAFEAFYSGGRPPDFKNTSIDKWIGWLDKNYPCEGDVDASEEQEEVERGLLKLLLSTEQGKALTQLSWVQSTLQRPGVQNSLQRYGINIDEYVTLHSTFPIKGDAQLGEEFTESDWLVACTTGNEQVIRQFLEKAKYEKLLNAPVEDSWPVSFAAGSYIGGPIKEHEFIPSVEGFRMLVNDERVETDFMIRVGISQMKFDEWLLVHVDYSKDQAKQARLNELKATLEQTLSDERKQELDDIRAQLEAQREQERQEIWQHRMGYVNKLTFVAGIVAAYGLLHYFGQRTQNAHTSSISTTVAT